MKELCFFGDIFIEGVSSVVLWLMWGGRGGGESSSTVQMSEVCVSEPGFHDQIQAAIRIRWHAAPGPREAAVCRPCGPAVCRGSVPDQSSATRHHVSLI